SGVSQRQREFNENIGFRTAPGIEYLHTNMEIRDGEFINFPVDGDLQVTYSQAIDLGNPQTSIVLVLDTFGSPQVAVTSSLSADEHTLIVHPVHRLEAGTDY